MKECLLIVIIFIVLHSDLCILFSPYLFFFFTSGKSIEGPLEKSLFTPDQPAYMIRYIKLSRPACLHQYARRTRKDLQQLLAICFHKILELQFSLDDDL